MLQAGVRGDYQVLGPHCCRVGNKVLRAYDSRFRHTHRRPDLYGDADIAPGSRVVCRIADDRTAEPGRPDHEFKLWDNRDPVIWDSEEQLWFWDPRGEILVIETDFHEGRHYAMSPSDFIPIVEHLQKIHDKGYVHGDIRCANIVFPKCLIDFDMGGRLDDGPTYPPGYKSCLNDGYRTGSGGMLITKGDDWFAMIDLMFRLHFLTPSDQSFSSQVDRHNRDDPFINLMYVPGLHAPAPLSDPKNIETLAHDLIAFLQDIESWEVHH